MFRTFFFIIFTIYPCSQFVGAYYSSETCLKRTRNTVVLASICDIITSADILSSHVAIPFLIYLMALPISSMFGRFRSDDLFKSSPKFSPNLFHCYLASITDLPPLFLIGRSGLIFFPPSFLVVSCGFFIFPFTVFSSVIARFSTYSRLSLVLLCTRLLFLHTHGVPWFSLLPFDCC